MHELQPKHSKMEEDEVKKLLEDYNISLSQLPKINKKDPALPEGCEKGDVIKIERKSGDDTVFYYRVVV